MSRETRAHAKNKNGEVVVHDTQSDAPILPITGIERLQSIRPDRVDWVFDQTQIEAEHRRSETHRTNTFIFIERIAAQILSMSVCICGIAGGIYAALNGHDWVGAVVASASIGTLAVAFLNRHKNKS
ncbi:MAG: hypothetical protein LBV44_02275 [Methylobacillus sp.]|jgi:hypothetical protein|nr:hypothetical protein [Methylobacillus sp.]